MTVYFDKDNFFSFWRSTKTHTKGRDLLRFIKKQVNVHFNFDMDTLDDEEWKITEEFQDGVCREWKWTKNYDRIKTRPINESSLPDKDGIYLLSDENILQVQSKHTYLIGGVNEEAKTLEKLMIDEDDYGFHSQRIIGKVDFNSWNKIEQYCLPFSTILVVDRYMFQGSEVGGNIGFFDYNIGTILSKLFEIKQGKARLIFVYQINTFVKIENRSYVEEPDFEKLKQKIKGAVKKINKNVASPEIILIGVPKVKKDKFEKQIEDEHDRHIITNYLRLKSGDSFVYFNSNGVKITKSNELDIYSLGKRLYRYNTNILIGKIKKIALEAQKEYPQGCSIKSENELNLKFDFYPEYEELT